MTEFVERTRQYYDKGALKFVSKSFTEYLNALKTVNWRLSKGCKTKALRVMAEAGYDYMMWIKLYIFSRPVNVLTGIPI